MANKYYELIKTPTMEINNKIYKCKTYNLTLKDFLIKYYNNKLFIFEDSIFTKQIKAIVL